MIKSYSAITLGIGNDPTSPKSFSAEVVHSCEVWVGDDSSARVTVRDTSGAILGAVMIQGLAWERLRREVEMRLLGEMMKRAGTPSTLSRLREEAAR